MLVGHAYNLSYLGGRGRRTEVQDWPRQRHGTLSKKQIKAKWVGRAQKAQSTNPSTTQEKKKIESKKERCYWLTEGRVQECYYNILQCIEQPATAKNYAALNVNDAKVEELCSK
jgi:hypothetical protein